MAAGAGSAYGAWVDVRVRDLLSGVLIGWGLLFGLSSLLLFAFIHGDDKR